MKILYRVKLFHFLSNRKVDLFDHLIHVWEVVKHYNSCRILFCINCSALRPPKHGLNDRIGRLFDQQKSKSVYSKGVFFLIFGQIWDLNIWKYAVFYGQFHCGNGEFISPSKWWVISIFQKNWKIDFSKIGFLKFVLKNRCFKFDFKKLVFKHRFFLIRS